MGFAPGPGTGNSSIAGSTDVALNSVTNNDTLSYDQSAAKWSNKQPSGADLSKIAATVVYGSDPVPDRPTGYERVVWVGAADPGTKAEDFDVWEQTA